jgi:hypothetical protein
MSSVVIDGPELLIDSDPNTWDVVAGPWRVQRTEDLCRFVVVRGAPDIGVQHLTSASGRPSRFKTSAAANRALRALQKQERQA